PLVSAGAAAIHAQPSVGRKVLGVTRDRDDVDGVPLVGVNGDGIPEVGRQIPADLVPRFAGVVAAHDVPVLLHEQRALTRAVRRDPVHAVTDLGIRVGNVLGLQSTVERSPRLAAIVRTEEARRGDGYEYPARLARIQKNSLQAHSTGPGLPARRGAVTAQPREFLPCLSTIIRAE